MWIEKYCLVSGDHERIRWRIENGGIQVIRKGSFRFLGEIGRNELSYRIDKPRRIINHETCLDFSSVQETRNEHRFIVTPVASQTTSPVIPSLEILRSIERNIQWRMKAHSLIRGTSDARSFDPRNVRWNERFNRTIWGKRERKRAREGEREQDDRRSECDRDTNMPFTGRSRNVGGSSNTAAETNQLRHCSAYHLLLWHRWKYFKSDSPYQAQHARNRLHLHEG